MELPSLKPTPEVTTDSKLFPEPVEPAGSEEPLKVLVVDDHQDILWTTKTQFELSGFVVETALGGALGLETARWFEPDVVLLDINLPDMSGRDVALELRSLAKKPLIIGVSGWPAETVEYEEAFDHYLLKPLELEVLLELIEKQCGERATSNVVRLDWWG